MQLAASALSSRKCLVQRPFVAVKPATRAAVRPMTICPVAKLTKASEFRGMSNDEIDSQVVEGKKELFSLRIKFAKREVRALQLLGHSLWPPAALACRGPCMRYLLRPD